MEYLKNMNGMKRYEYFKTKILSDLTIEELAFIHLDIDSHSCHLQSPYYLTSNLFDLVETISASFSNRRTRIYVPVMTCFAILDQIGSIYNIKGNTSDYGNGIKRAISIFATSINDDDMKSLVSLRNGLLHDGSLLNIPRYNNTPHVIFRMKQNLGQLLKQADTEWNGTYHDDLSPYTTYIDLKELQELTINIINKCKDELLNDNLDISITDPKEFYFKYLFSGQVEEEV